MRLLFASLCLCLSLNALATTTEYISPLKSPIDKKLYRYVELENQLKVLLVSDETTDKSAASLDVYVGSGSDPEGWEGLAHFLEHMLFLGTEKYPEVSEYSEFIKDNGGGNNAYTSFGHTNYYFSIGTDHLENALDRFSQFFIAPRFDETYVDRERSVVYSEYQARKKDEGRRLWDAQKQWLNPSHPASRFTVGSLESLRDRDESSAREKLIEFYNDHYSANIMTLVVLGKEPLDQLEKWARQYFQDINNKNLAPQEFTQSYMDPDLIPARLDTVPVKEQSSVSFVFPIPSTAREYSTKPLSYISNLLGHEGEGSLFSVLKQAGWAEGLSAGSGYLDEVQGQFNVRIQLTNQGVEHIKEMGQMLFQMIDLIKRDGVVEWRYKEQSELSEIAFRFAQESDPGRVAQSLASRLHQYEPEDVLAGPYLIKEFDPERINQLLTYLTPNNVSINVVSQNLETDKVTQYYDVDYKLSKLSEQWISQWGKLTTNEQLRLPDVNPFIPEWLEVGVYDESKEIPVEVETKSDITLWYKPDVEFDTPRANFYFNIMSPLANSSARNLVLTELYVRLLNSQLNKAVYPAYLADLNYSLYRHGKGISGRISGYEDKQSEILRLIIDAMLNPEFTEQRFNIIKTRLKRELNNIALDSPSNQSIHEIYRLLMTPYWAESERLQALESVTLEDVTDFSEKFFQQVEVNALSHGDVSLESSLSRVSMLDALFMDSEFITDIPEVEIRSLKQEDQYLRTKSVEHSDSALSWYFQGSEASIQERAKMALLKDLLDTAFYTLLRTDNRVGYLVHSGVININQFPGFLFSVQSPSHTPQQLSALYDQFIAQFENDLENMSMQEFSTVKSGLLVKVRQKDKNLSGRSARYWREIERDELNFDSQQQFDNALSELTHEAMKDYYQNIIVSRGAEIAVQIPGDSADLDSALISEEHFKETGDPIQFRHQYESL